MNFSNERAKKYLNTFIDKLNSVDERIEEGDITKNEIKEVFADLVFEIQSELKRSERLEGNETEEVLFQPALQEALAFLERLESADSPTEVASIIYDTNLSLDYYRAHLK